MVGGELDGRGVYHVVVCAMAYRPRVSLLPPWLEWSTGLWLCRGLDGPCCHCTFGSSWLRYATTAAAWLPSTDVRQGSSRTLSPHVFSLPLSLLEVRNDDNIA